MTIIHALKGGRTWLRDRPALWRLGRSLGLNQVARRVHDRALIHQGRYDLHFLGQSLRFAITDPREIHRFEMLRGEHTFIRRMIEAIQPGDTFFDIGANIGIVSLLTAGCKQSEIAVHAFEPEPRNADRLQHNVRLNHLDQVVRVHRVALGNRDGNIQLFVEGGVGSGTHSIISDGNLSTSASTIDVVLRTVDAFTEEFHVTPSLAKLDVEGAELDVLEGMSNSLSRGIIRELFIEVHPSKMAAAGRSADNLRKYIERRNYKLLWSSERGGETHLHYRHLT